MKMNWNGFGKKHSWHSPGAILITLAVMMIMIIHLFIFLSGGLSQNP
jgi:hypothetical protein